VIKKIEHIGIAVEDLGKSEELFEKLLGKKPYKKESVKTEGVKTSFFKIADQKLELLHATRMDSPIKKFIEKPNLKLAEELIKDKSYSWNSGIFISKASVLIRELEKFSPEIITLCKQAFKDNIDDLDFKRLDKYYFNQCPDISIDKALMEKTSSGVVFPLHVEWSDIGGWQSFWENSLKDINGNVLIGDAIEMSSKNCLIKSNSRLTVGLGIEDLVVIETNDAVLVSKKSESEKVKSIVEKLRSSKRREGDENVQVFRPWGSYDSIDNGGRFKVKRITVKPGEKLSVQMHHHRAEHWVVVSGTANVTIGDETQMLTENESVYIPIGAVHALENPGKIPLELIEVQSGAYLGEDDIVRFSDRYGRSDK